LVLIAKFRANWQPCAVAHSCSTAAHSNHELKSFCVERYSNNLVDAKTVGIKKGLVSGFNSGFLFFAMYSMYGLSFWYGTTEVLKGNIKVGDMMTTFFNILIAAFGVGTVG